MLNVHTGQCGLCAHFGEEHTRAQNLVQIRTTHKADEHTIDNCGHPKHASLSLKVTAISSCNGFTPADTH